MVALDGGDLVLWKNVYRSYFRMCATVVVASSWRLVLDSICIVIAGETPAVVGFWFGHCFNGRCVAIAMFEFLIAWLGAALFVWRYQEWLVGECNPYAGALSWPIIIGGAEWMALSVAAGKVNVLVEFLRVTDADFVNMMINSVLALVLTFAFSVVTHFSMKQRAVAVSGGFRQFAQLLLLYCLGFAAGWSWWNLVQVLLQGTGELMSCLGLLSAVAVSGLFYVSFGPEPILPQLDGTPNRTSLRRNVTSFLVYSSMIVLVCCFVDPSFGFLKRGLVLFHEFEYPLHMDMQALALWALMAWFVTVLGAFVSFLMSKWSGVDFTTSIKTSRMEIESEMQRANAAGREIAPHFLQKKMRAAQILTFDSLGFIAAFECGYLVMAVFGRLCSRLSPYPALYVIGSFAYSILVTLMTTRAVLVLWPTDEEIERKRGGLARVLIVGPETQMQLSEVTRAPFEGGSAESTEMEQA